MIHLVVSQAAEARLLVEHLGLAADAGGVFPLSRGNGVALVVSGGGKMNAAAATAHLHLAVGGGRDGAWLNVGVAGHADVEIGSGLLAHKVVDAGSGASWYPPALLGRGRTGEGEATLASRPIDGEPSTATLVTVDRLEGEYDGAALYDTEAAGFFTAAGRFATVELVQAYKVVADNHAATLGDNFGSGVVEDLVRSKLAVLAALLDELRGMAETARLPGRGREAG